MTFTHKLEEALSEYASKIENTIQAAKDLPEIGHLYTTIEPGSLRVDIPFTPTAYAEYRKALGNKWQSKKGSSWKTDDGDSYFTFEHKGTGVFLALCLDAESKNATCKRIQVGEKKIPIFETVCS